ncbi:hypothetical protein VCV18_008024 [Metarhizium anisopliae]
MASHDAGMGVVCSADLIAAFARRRAVGAFVRSTLWDSSCGQSDRLAGTRDTRATKMVDAGDAGDAAVAAHAWFERRFRESSGAAPFGNDNLELNLNQVSHVVVCLDAADDARNGRTHQSKFEPSPTHNLKAKAVAYPAVIVLGLSIPARVNPNDFIMSPSQTIAHGYARFPQVVVQPQPVALATFCTR